MQKEKCSLYTRSRYFEQELVGKILFYQRQVSPRESTIFNLSIRPGPTRYFREEVDGKVVRRKYALQVAHSNHESVNLVPPSY